MGTELHRLTLRDALAGLEAGRFTLASYLDALNGRISEREGVVGAWEALTPPDDLRRKAERGAGLPFRGVPFGVKDIIDTADLPTAMGSPIHAGRRPSEDAACVARLRARGATVMGKTVTTEFAYFRPGRTANPRDPRRTPGGSSSGSAAAVADGMVPFALGSQTAASAIRPAAYCGVVGYVASQGACSLRGVQPLAQSFDALGILARSVEDVRLVRAALLAPDSLPAPVRNPRLLVVPGHRIGPCEDEMEEALQATAARLRREGWEVAALDPGDRLGRLVELHAEVMAFEAARNLAPEARHREAMSPALLALIDRGEAMPLAEYRAARAAIAEQAEWLRAVMGEADAILAPAAPGVAPEGLGATGSPHMSRPWQALGLPTVALPGRCDAAGLPLGLQLVGRRDGDDDLLTLAARAAGLMAEAGRAGAEPVGGPA